MPIDLNKKNRQTGIIEVICGCMFSGKTKELIRRIKDSGIQQQKIGVFKPSIDIRYHSDKIVSHDSNSVDATPIQEGKQIVDHVDGLELVAIDEAQFFEHALVEAVQKIADQGIRVIVAGLDMDYRGIPFGPMPALLSIANHVTQLHAICERCGGEASFSYRKTRSDEQVLIGEKNEYEARCISCFDYN
jgi:thymidine kinase